MQHYVIEFKILPQLALAKLSFPSIYIVVLDLGYGQLQPTRLTSKARIDARNEMRELPSRLETPDQFLVSFYKIIIKGIFNLLPFVAFFHEASLFSTGVDNEKVVVDSGKALELTNSTVFHRGRQ